MTQIDDATLQALEAAAFRRLRDHLQNRTDVQNIDLIGAHCLVELEDAEHATGKQQRQGTRKCDGEFEAELHGFSNPWCAPHHPFGFASLRRPHLVRAPLPIPVQ